MADKKFSWESIQPFLSQKKLDGWLLYDFNNINTIARKLLGLEKSAITRRFYFLIPTTGRPSVLASQIDVAQFQGISADVVTYTSWDTMVNKLKEMLGGMKRIAMEYSPRCSLPYISKVDAGTIELIQELGVQVESSADLIQFFSSRIDKRQLELHVEAGKKLTKINDEAFDLIGDRIYNNKQVTEYEVQQFILKRLEEESMRTEFVPVVAINENSADPHYMPSADKHSQIKHGDIILIDMWGKIDEENSIFADITWMGMVGKEVPTKYAEVFELIVGARDKGIEFIQQTLAEGKPVYGWEVDDVIRNYIVSKGYGKYFTHRSGHSLGESVHGDGVNLDNFETKDERTLIPGICFTIEPGIYLPEFGVRLETDFYVRNGGIEITTPLQNEIRLIHQ